MSPQAQTVAPNQRETRTISDMIVDRLSRVTSSGSFIPEIDGLRFFAIASVVLFHINTYVVNKSPLDFASTVTHHPLNLMFQQGFIGVSLFFTISGFILSLPFAIRYLQGRSSPSLGSYYMRRVTRLEPPYIINMFLTFLLLIVVKNESARDLFPHLLASLSYSHNIIYEQFSFINGVAWSLEIEVQFYLLAPLLCKVFLIRQAFWRRLFFIIIVLCGYGLSAVTHALGYTYVSLFDYLQFFLVGFFLTDLYIVNWQKQPDQEPLWDLWATACWILIFAIARQWYSAYLTPMLILVSYTAAFRGRIWNQIVSNRWIATIGSMCYTIYLYHYWIISLVGRLSVTFALTHHYWINILFQIFILSAAVLVASSMFFILFEKPFMYKDWPNKLRLLNHAEKAVADASDTGSAHVYGTPDPRRAAKR